MKLSDFLRTLNPEQRAEFASKVSAAGSVGYLYLVAGGHRRASGELARKIEEHSGGVVTRVELRPDIFGPVDATAQPASDDTEDMTRRVAA